MYIAREQIILITPYFESILIMLAKAKHTKPLYHSDCFIWKDLDEKERDRKKTPEKTQGTWEGGWQANITHVFSNLTFLMRTCFLEFPDSYLSQGDYLAQSICF